MLRRGSRGSRGSAVRVRAAKRYGAGESGEARGLLSQGYPMSITRKTMRPDHTTADYAQSLEALPAASPDTGGDDSLTGRAPLARMTFCFAWLFGLEPFLAGGTTTQSRSGADRSL